MTELALLENPPTAIQLFYEGAANDFIEKIKEEVKKFKPDISTKAGRAEIASLARRIASAKTKTDEMGKKLTEDEKKKIEMVNAERRRVWDEMEGIQHGVRAPLTEWEEAEKSRAKDHEDTLAFMEQQALIPPDYDAIMIQARINNVSSYDEGRDWQEFSERAIIVKAKVNDTLKEALDRRTKYEAEQAELAELRRKQAEQEQKDRDERIAREAADKAKREAEERAAVEAEATEHHRLTEVANREAAERKAEDARKAAEKAEQDRIDAEARHHQEMSEQREKAKKEAQEAVRQEQERAERAAKIIAEQIAAEDAKREANKRHKTKINNEVLKAMQAVIVNCDPVKDDGLKTLIEAIVKGQIPHTTIKY